MTRDTSNPVTTNHGDASYRLSSQRPPRANNVAGNATEIKTSPTKPMASIPEIPFFKLGSSILDGASIGRIKKHVQSDPLDKPFKCLSAIKFVLKQTKTGATRRE